MKKQNEIELPVSQITPAEEDMSIYPKKIDYIVMGVIFLIPVFLLINSIFG